MLAAADEQVWLEARRHGIVLLRPLLRAGGFAVAGAGVVSLGWPYSPVGVALLGIGAALAARAVWRWDRTQVVVTTEKLFIVSGTFRRRAAAVRLTKVSTVEIEESLLGRALGYGTIVAGDLEIRYVPEPERICGLVSRLGA